MCRLFCLLCFFGLVYVPGDAAEPAYQDVAGRTVKLGLIRADDRSPVAWPSGNAGLSTESIVIGPDTNIAERLLQMGINPDAGAWSLLYDLNPTVHKLDTMTPGTRLVVPSVVASPELRGQLASGSELVVLSVDPELREKLNGANTALTGLVSTLKASSQERFGRPEDKNLTVRQLDDITVWLEHIRQAAERRAGPPTSRDTWAELNDEAGMLQRLLAGSQTLGERLTPDDVSQISAIHSDLEREIRRYDDVMSGGIPEPDELCCTVEVTLVGGDTKKLDGIRVYYVLNGYFRQPPPAPSGVRAFADPGSGRSIRLRAKNYQMWAAPDGKPENLLTEGALLVEIYASEKQKTVTLRLKGPDDSKEKK